MNNTMLSSRSEYGGLVAALAATTVAALIPALVADSFRETFDAFGADLPAITSFFLNHHWWLLVVPAALLGLWALWHDNPNRGRIIGVIGINCSFLTIATAVTAMYNPIFKLNAII